MPAAADHGVDPDEVPGRHRPRQRTASIGVTDRLAALGVVASDYLIRTVSVLGVLAVAGIISSATADPAPSRPSPVSPTHQEPTHQGPTHPAPSAPGKPGR